MKYALLISLLVLLGRSAAGQTLSQAEWEQSEQMRAAKASWYPQIAVPLTNLNNIVSKTYEDIKDLPGKVVTAWQWCIDTVVMFAAAFVFAYGQRFFMIFTRTWRPKT